MTAKPTPTATENLDQYNGNPLAQTEPRYARTHSATTRHIIRPGDSDKTLCGSYALLPEFFEIEETGATKSAAGWMFEDMPVCRRCEASANKRGLNVPQGAGRVRDISEAYDLAHAEDAARSAATAPAEAVEPAAPVKRPTDGWTFAGGETWTKGSARVYAVAAGLYRASLDSTAACPGGVSDGMTYGPNTGGLHAALAAGERLLAKYAPAPAAYSCDGCGRTFAERPAMWSDRCGWCRWGTPDGQPPTCPHCGLPTGTPDPCCAASLGIDTAEGDGLGGLGAVEYATRTARCSTCGARPGEQCYATYPGGGRVKPEQRITVHPARMHAAGEGCGQSCAQCPPEVGEIGELFAARLDGWDRRGRLDVGPHGVRLNLVEMGAETYVEHIAVPPALRQRGYGSAVLDALTGWADRGGVTLRLSVSGAHGTPESVLRQLYASRGFRSDGVGAGMVRRARLAPECGR